MPRLGRKWPLHVVLLDLWGTILYPVISLEDYYKYRAEAIRKVLGEEGYVFSLDEVLKALKLARKVADAIRRENVLELTFRGEAVLLLRELGLDYDNSSLVERVATAYLEPYLKFLAPPPDLKGFLLKLGERGVKIGVVSNAGSYNALIRVLRKSGLAGFFNVVISSDRIGYRKPSPVIFMTALSLLGARPENAVFVGDEDIDIRGALSIGLWTAVYEGFHPYQGTEPHIRVKSYTELWEKLSSIFQL